ncbi:barstar family protein [Amycolatopsis sp. NPDC059657]|uniref:barstar family protein n=1 Tax=Amycolatopsis sp. NPDC059657 TaxID=3346899 RepID=UPI00366ADE6E
MWTEAKPWLHAVEKDANSPIVDVLPPGGTTFVAHLNGASMTTTDGVFEQFYNELRFPAYFGWNWNALFECLRDLAWIPADRYLLVIENPGEILTSDDDDLDHLTRILFKAAKEWSSSLGKPNGIATPLNVIFICDKADIATVRQNIAVYQP